MICVDEINENSKKHGVLHTLVVYLFILYFKSLIILVLTLVASICRLRLDKTYSQVHNKWGGVKINGGLQGF